MVPRTEQLPSVNEVQIYTALIDNTTRWQQITFSRHISEGDGNMSTATNYENGDLK